MDLSIETLVTLENLVKSNGTLEKKSFQMNIFLIYKQFFIYQLFPPRVNRSINFTIIPTVL